MSIHQNPKLKLFVDSVFTYINQLVSSVLYDITVNYNPHTNVYWFVLSKNRDLIENKFVGSLDELDVAPRLVQLGWVDADSVKPLLFVFMNERGTYSKATPHSLPTASCDTSQAKMAAQTVYNYLTTGRFTGGMEYGVQRKIGGPVKMCESTETRSAAVVKSVRQFTFGQAKTPTFEYLDDFKVNKRIKRILLENYIYTRRAVSRMNESELLALHGIGPKSVEQIKLALKDAGLKLKVKRKKK